MLIIAVNQTLSLSHIIQALETVLESSLFFFLSYVIFLTLGSALWVVIGWSCSEIHQRGGKKIENKKMGEFDLSGPFKYSLVRGGGQRRRWSRFWFDKFVLGGSVCRSKGCCPLRFLGFFKFLSSSWSCSLLATVSVGWGEKLSALTGLPSRSLPRCKKVHF